MVSEEGRPGQAGMPRRLDHVQGLRAFAVLVVVIYHCDLPLSGGFLGVDVFFVISGYVIAGLLLREHVATGGVRFGRFYLRRIRRLLPALALTLVVVAVLSALFESPFHGQRVTGRVGMFGSVSLANYALYTTDAGYFAPAAGSVTLRHLWTLSVEEQIYLIFPLFLVLVLAVGRRRPRVLGWSVLIVAALSFVSLVVLGHAHHFPLLERPSSAAYYLPFTRAWEFAAGVLLAVWHTSRPALGRIATLVAGSVGAALCAFAVVVLDSADQANGVALLAPVVGATLVLLACRGGGWLQRGLAWRPLRWIGDRSYGWYLWHWPLIVLAKDEWPDSRWVEVAAALVALGVTLVSYRFVEQRFRYPRRDAPPRAQARSGVLLAAVCFLVPVVALAGLRFAATHDWNSSTVQAMDRQVSPLPPGARTGGCDIAGALQRDSIASCTIGSGAGAPLYVLGDSNAGQWVDGLVVAARASRHPVIVGWRPGCPFVAVTVQRPSYDVAGCDRYNALFLRWLQQHPAGEVVLSSANEFIGADGVSLRDPATGAVATDPGAKARMWTSGLRRDIEALSRAGHYVAMISALPHPGGADRFGKQVWDAATCGLLTILRDQARCGITVSLRAEDSREHDALAAETSAARQTRTRYLDLRSAVCPGGVCATVRAGQWIYRNGEHITVDESRRLASLLATLLDR